MTIEEATKIATKYCEKNHPFRRAIYAGMFNENLLFRLSFNGGGHHGQPLFVVLKNSKIVELKKNSATYFKAWDSSILYVKSFKGSQDL